jgi:hypothetical protein
MSTFFAAVILPSASAHKNIIGLVSVALYDSSQEKACIEAETASRVIERSTEVHGQSRFSSRVNRGGTITTGKRH